MSKFRKETNLILMALQNGDKTKWETLYLYTFDHLRGMAIKYLADKTEWADVVSQTYLQAFRYIGSFNPSKDGYNWLCKIAHNIALDFNKRRFPTVNIDDVSDKIFVYMDQLVEDKNGLYKELALLPYDDQQLIWLRFWEELSYHEIARVVKSKKSTVHIRINKILKNIEEKLK